MSKEFEKSYIVFPVRLFFQSYVTMILVNFGLIVVCRGDAPYGSLSLSLALSLVVAFSIYLWNFCKVSHFEDMYILTKMQLGVWLPFHLLMKHKQYTAIAYIVAVVTCSIITTALGTVDGYIIQVSFNLLCTVILLVLMSPMKGHTSFYALTRNYVIDIDSITEE